MSLSATYSESFTRTHAKYLASKVVTDLYQCSRLYGAPVKADIEGYEQELIEMLAGGYVSAYEFGFKKGESRLVSWQYRVTMLGTLVGGDDRAGGIYTKADVSGASYYNFMTYSSAWSNLSPAQKDLVSQRHPVSRTTGTLPADGNGYWTEDRTYSNGGVSVGRRTFRPG